MCKMLQLTKSRFDLVETAFNNDGFNEINNRDSVEVYLDWH